MDKSVYQRPKKPKTMLVTKRTGAPEMALPDPVEAIAVHSSTECHVTPPEVAARMVEYLGPPGDYLTVDPEAGTGALLKALFDASHSVNELVAIEREASLCKAIRKRFKGDQYINPINRCFLEYTAEAVGKVEYPRIIMNPPFRHVKKHVEAALSLLGRNGHELATLVALVPITFDHDEAEELEILPNTTFATAKVNTKIIRFTR